MSKFSIESKDGSWVNTNFFLEQGEKINFSDKVAGFNYSFNKEYITYDSGLDLELDDIFIESDAVIYKELYQCPFCKQHPCIKEEKISKVRIERVDKTKPLVFDNILVTDLVENKKIDNIYELHIGCRDGCPNIITLIYTREEIK